VDHARGHLRLKRGGDRQRVQLEEKAALFDYPDLDLLALDEALQKLAQLHERQARIVELRFFGGLELKDVAEYSAFHSARSKAIGEWPARGCGGNCNSGPGRGADGAEEPRP